MKEKTLKIEDIYDINDALDLYSRILCGQYDELLYFYGIRQGYSEEILQLKTYLISLRRICIPELTCDLNGSLGIWNPKTPQNAIKAYDIRQILRYQIAYHNFPEGGITVNFNWPYIHGNWKLSEEDKTIICNTVQSFQYPDYYPLGLHGKFWDCPLIITSFNDEKNIATLMRSRSIDIIINKALDFYKDIHEKNLEKAFLSLYPNAKEQKREDMLYFVHRIQEYIEDIEE